MVYIIILGYHAVEDIRRCVDSVLKTNYPIGRWRIVVVDNDSRPETRECLASYGERLDVLPQETNTGYAGGMNIGIRHALVMGAEYVVLLNQDAEVDPTWITQLVMAAESDPRIGAVQPRVMLGDGGDLVNSIGNDIHVLGFGFAGGHGERWAAIRPRLRGYPYPEVTYPSGAAVLYRASALMDVAFPRTLVPPLRVRGGEGELPSDHNPSQPPLTLRGGGGELDRLQFLDEDYFLYHEDLDIGVRLWMRGWRCVLAPQAVVYHRYEFSRSITKLYWMERNRILFLLQNFRIPTLLVLAPALIVSELGLLVLAKRGGWLSQELKAWRSLLNPKHWATFRRHRREKQAKRVLGDRVVLLRFVSRFTNQEMANPLVERYVNPVIAAWWRCARPLIRW